MPAILALHRSVVHEFSKQTENELRLIAGLGVEGDVHAGETVKHRSRVARDPSQPNLRQVHLIHAELFDELRNQGFDITPGLLGENVTTRGLNLLALPRGARLHLGDKAIVEVTGLRNPCTQLDGIAPGLMRAVLGRDTDGNLIRKCGIMGVVRESGGVRTGDTIRVEMPDGAKESLGVV